MLMKEVDSEAIFFLKNWLGLAGGYAKIFFDRFSSYFNMNGSTHYMTQLEDKDFLLIVDQSYPF